MRFRSLLGALLAACAASSLAGADTIVVTQVNFTFQPADVVVDLGDTVRWVWTGGDHTVTEGTDGTVDGNEAFHSLLTSGVPVYEVTFDQTLLNAFPRPGNTYDYFCAPHFFFNMTGTVTVSTEPGASYCDCDGAGAAPCANPGGAGEGCANSTGAGGVLAASGSASAAADDLAFAASGLLPSQPALLFVGNTALNGGAGLAFGDGLRCAGNNVIRLGVDTPDAGGSASWGPGLGATAGWGAGDARFFQVWYRDPSGGPCGSGFNLTNGYEVTFGS